MKYRTARQIKAMTEGTMLVNLVTLHVPDMGTIRLTDAAFDIEEAGDVWSSNGLLLEMNNSKDNGSVKPSSFDLNLSGAAQESLDIATFSRTLYSHVEHRQGYWDEVNGELIDGSFIIRSGRIINIKIVDGDSPVVGFVIANKWSNLQNTRGYAADNAFWLQYHEGDTFFKEVGRQ